MMRFIGLLFLFVPIVSFGSVTYTSFDDFFSIAPTLAPLHSADCDFFLVPYVAPDAPPLFDKGWTVDANAQDPTPRFVKTGERVLTIG